MPNPTLEDDIAALRSYIGAEEGDGRPWAHDAVAALDRLAKAVGERGHLEEAARLLVEADLTEMSRAAEQDHCLRRRQWLDRERERKRSEPVVESTR